MDLEEIVVIVVCIFVLFEIVVFRLSFVLEWLIYVMFLVLFVVIVLVGWIDVIVV